VTRPPAKGHIKEQLKPVDTIIGNNLRVLRRAAGIGSPTMAKHLDLSYQQLQKYECATNRLACSTLYVIANYLKLSPLAFYSGLPLHEKTSFLSLDQMTKLGWRDVEALQLFLNLDRDTKTTVLSVLRALQ
jgi:transcriptional regulator with XRE-family HTH domain